MGERDWYQSEPDDQLMDVEEEIFQYIADKVTTYPQEVSIELGHSLSTVQHHLRVLYKSKRIVVLQTLFNRPPDRIMRRLPELQTQGMSGNDIRKRTWYCVNETGAQLRERLFLEGKGQNSLVCF